MMTLLKNDILQSFGICHLKSFKKKHWFFLFAFVVFFLIVLYGLYSFSRNFVEISQDAGMENIVLTVIIITISLFCFVTNLYRGTEMIFSSKEYNLLLTLPISNWKIIVSKFFSLYLFNLDVAITLLVPTVIAYGQIVNPGASFYFVILVASLVIPIIPIVIATLIGVGIKSVSSKLPLKNVWHVILVILFLVFLLFLSNSVTESSSIEIENIYQRINNIYPPTYFVIKGVEGHYLYLLAFFGVSLLIMVFFVFLMAKNSLKIINMNSKSRGAKTRIKYDSKPIILTLYKREAKRYFSMPMYVLNTAIMLIIVLAFSVFSFTNQSEIVTMKKIMDDAVPLFMAVFVGLSNTTSCSISLEGKSIDQLLALPVTSKDILTSKILFNLSLTIPTIIISSILYGISSKQDLFGFVMLIIIPGIYAIYSATIGLIINIIFPDFDWQNPIKVIKQSLSTLFGMLGGVAIAIIPLVMFYGFSIYNVAFIIILFGLAMVAVLCYLYTIGIKQFEKIVS